MGIKYKAWLLWEKAMVDVITINLQNKWIGYYDFSDCDLETEYRILLSGEHNADCGFELCDLLRFTGLRDKNGKDIYEGDIVKVTDEADEIGGTDTGIGVVEWLDRWGLWNVSKIENGLGDLLYNGYVEVIGNIYEHPHLLEEDSNEL